MRRKYKRPEHEELLVADVSRLVRQLIRIRQEVREMQRQRTIGRLGRIARLDGRLQHLLRVVQLQVAVDVRPF